MYGSGWSQSELIAAAADCQGLIVRSGTQVDRALIRIRAPNLPGDWPGWGRRRQHRPRRGIRARDHRAQRGRRKHRLGRPNWRSGYCSRCLVTSRPPTRPCAPASGIALRLSAPNCAARRLASSAWGLVGAAVARRLQAMEMRTIAFDSVRLRRTRPAASAPSSQRCPNCCRSPMWSRCTPRPRPMHRRFWGGEELSAIKSGALLVNTARGRLIRRIGAG